MMRGILVLPLLAAAAHVFEEFVWPGGFSRWYHAYRPVTARSFTRAYAVGINALLLAVCALIPLMGDTPRGAALWLTIAALVAANAVFHLRAAVVTRRYSPGVVTATLLYVPMAFAGFAFFVSSGRASSATAAAAAVMGGSYNMFSAAIHRRRGSHAH